MNDSDLQPRSFTEVQANEELYIEDSIIRNEQINGVTLASFSLRNVVFERCIFVDCNFERWELTDVVFRHCDLSNCHFEQGYFYRTTFLNCKLVGAKLMKSRFKQCNFEQCFASYAASFTPISHFSSK